MESRPDLVKKLTNEVQGNGQPEQPRIELDKDEFDPWEAYNDPSSKSYQFRQQELNDTVNNAISSEVDKKSFWNTGASWYESTTARLICKRFK